MMLKFSQTVNQLYAFIYEANHSKSGLELPFIVALDGQSTDVEAPPDIIDVDEDDDFIDDDDGFPRDLADSDEEVLANDDDDVAVVYSSEEED
uniref:Uncharacterized protein n=1 Tax=Tanacetum cinerariifolium TaxID=118510 RepID=A0A6L2N9A7_TANCI|nr:hypothetical protein [Tanacetum cinerariifolium]